MQPTGAKLSASLKYNDFRADTLPMIIKQNNGPGFSPCNSSSQTTTVQPGNPTTQQKLLYQAYAGAQFWVKDAAMKMNRFLVTLSVILLGLLVATAVHANNYTLVKQEGGIFLYEKWIAVPGGQTVRELKVVFYAKTGPDRVLAVLKDPAKGKEWNQRVKEHQVLEEKGKPGWITYTHYSIPWPVGDQDCCLAYTLRKNDRYTELLFTGTSHPLFPQRENTGRIGGIQGKWLLEQQMNGLLKVTYTICSDKSKKLPKWVTDPVIHNNMIKSIGKFITILENPEV